jgi:hypothetical protein
MMNMTERRKRLTAKIKYNIFLKTKEANAPIGEILREYGLHLSDLREIEETVELGAIAWLKTKTKQTKLKEVSVAEYQALQQELEMKNKALAELTVQYFILKKNDA